jgi:flagellar basal-body rod protein FlgB
MFFSEMVDRGAVPALVKTLAYNHARLRLISENVANIHTPGYRAKHLDTRAFQGALREALEARGNDPRKPFVVNVDGQVQTDRQGHLRVTPTEEPVENVLFHDGTNMSIERQMADLAETGMANELATTLLRGRLQALRTAIRGTVG